ncbi:hypothetical protein [Burkholderia territorii]|uniref:hypothetical protein n=1 Tax=Burkholderia territorii TaxID=1503055 RepID=UPI0012D85DCA|nr:hypothetical protein [Burkholderia territorii]
MGAVSLLMPLLWFFHPLAFIRYFRRCGWLASRDLASIYPDKLYKRKETSDPGAKREEYRILINHGMRQKNGGKSKHAVDRLLLPLIKLALFHSTASMRVGGIGRQVLQAINTSRLIRRLGNWMFLIKRFSMCLVQLME